MSVPNKAVFKERKPMRNNAGGVYKNIGKKEKIPLIFLFILYANTLKCTIFLVAVHKKGGF
jgi:hypothetical protein